MINNRWRRGRGGGGWGQDFTLCEEELSELFSEKHKIPLHLPSPNTTEGGYRGTSVHGSR